MKAKPILQGGLLVGAVALLAAQLYRPRLDISSSKAELQAPGEVKQILQHSCYNCHSNHTDLPWFDQVAPARWIAVHDIVEGRKHLNFSEIENMPAFDKRATLWEAVNMVQLGRMPLPSYLAVHPHAHVTPAELAVLKNYVRSITPMDSADVSAGKEAERQYTYWLKAGGPLTPVKLPLSGVPYFPNYRNWKVISATDRFDIGTINLVLGNDEAVRAVASNQINPWPDGVVFAKVGWDKQVAPNGDVKAGTIKFVEFMVKGSETYKATAGWGFAGYRGPEMRAYGKDKNFVHECLSCHSPMRNNDQTFTLPLPAQESGR